MNVLKNKLINSFLLIFSLLFLIEVIFRLCVGMNLLDWASIRVLSAILFVSFLLSLILSFFNDKINKIVIITFISIFDIYAFLQAGFNNFLGTFMSLNTSSQIGAVKTFIIDYFKSIKIIYWLILIPLILLIIYYKVLSKKLSIHKEEKRLKELFILLAIMNILLYYNTFVFKFMQNDMQIISNKKLFKNPVISNLAINQFGLGIYGMLDIKSLFTDDSKELTYININNNRNIKDEYIRHIDDSKWIQLNKNEKDSVYKKLNNYFINKEITSKNEYTGIFKDKNLIVIMIESGSNVLTDYPEYFPNVAKLYNEGWSWTNAFSPKNACSTGNNEMSGIVSLYTINNECTVNNYENNKYFESLFNLFNKKNYKTSSYHDYTEQYYDRYIYHINMGSGKYYNVDDLGIKLGSEYQPWPSDEEFFKKAIPNFINQDKFMVWLTTVSSHYKYNISSTTGDKYIDLFKDNFSIDNKRYMSKLKIFDDALGLLLKELEQNNKLDDTVIVMYADHEPYGLSQDKFSEIAKYNIKDKNRDRTPFIIYNPKLEPTKYSEYTSYINILPALANLFDLDYDPRLYAGTDLLSDSYLNFVVFSDGSWLSDIAYFDALNSKITYFSNKIYTYDEIKKINNKVANEIIMDNLAIRKDYFTYLDKKLNDRN